MYRERVDIILSHLRELGLTYSKTVPLYIEFGDDALNISPVESYIMDTTAIQESLLLMLPYMVQSNTTAHNRSLYDIAYNHVTGQPLEKNYVVETIHFSSIGTFYEQRMLPIPSTFDKDCIMVSLTYFNPHLRDNRQQLSLETGQRTMDFYQTNTYYALNSTLFDDDSFVKIL